VHLPCPYGGTKAENETLFASGLTLNEIVSALTSSLSRGAMS
jgi:hypothetical protein